MALLLYRIVINTTVNIFISLDHNFANGHVCINYVELRRAFAPTLNNSLISFFNNLFLFFSRPYGDEL